MPGLLQAGWYPAAPDIGAVCCRLKAVAVLWLQRDAADKAAIVRLSPEMLDKQVLKNAELSSEDYRRLVRTSAAQIVIRQADRVLIYVTPIGDLFDVVVVKATIDGNELFVSSYRMQNARSLRRLVKAGEVIRGNIP
jgi:hypothetical protein